MALVLLQQSHEAYIQIEPGDGIHTVRLAKHGSHNQCLPLLAVDSFHLLKTHASNRSTDG